MKSILKPFIIVAGLLLIGQGCFGGTSRANDGGLWQSGDAGESWEQLSNLPQLSGVASIGGVNVLDLAIDPNDDAVYYLGTAQNGLFYTLDNAKTWQRPRQKEFQSGQISNLVVHPKNSCIVYGLRGTEIIQTIDCARSFKVLYQQTGGDSLTGLAVDWFNPDIIWAGTSDGDVIKSVDGGQTWSASLRVGDAITAIELSNADSRIVMVGTEDKGYYYSQDAGESWFEYEDELSDYRGSDEVFDFSQTEDGSLVVMLTSYGLLGSLDAGESWEAFSLVTAPGEIVIYDVEVDPNDASTIYYATDGTLYISTDQGRSWNTQSLPSSRALLDLEMHDHIDGLLLGGFAAIDD